MPSSILTKARVLRVRDELQRAVLELENQLSGFILLRTEVLSRYTALTVQKVRVLAGNANGVLAYQPRIAHGSGRPCDIVKQRSQP